MRRKRFGRNWGVLIALVGSMLIHGAFNVPRGLALLAAIASKAMFISLVLSNGTQYLAHGAGTAVVFDTIMVVVFAAYLVSAVGVTTVFRESQASRSWSWVTLPRRGAGCGTSSGDARSSSQPRR